jgi:hypothetical protein
LFGWATQGEESVYPAIETLDESLFAVYGFPDDGRDIGVPG